MNRAEAKDRIGNLVDKLLLKDARLLTETLLPDIPCVDVIITSPPYWNLKDYGVDSQIGYGQTKTEYLADLQNIMSECLSVTKSTGSLWLVVDTYREGGELQLLPFELANCARNAGWKLRDLIVWDKQHSVPWQSKGQLRSVFECILFLTKSDDFRYHVERVKTLDEISKWWVDFPERYNPKGKTPTNIWSIPMRPRGAWRKPSENDHYCSFPTMLAARIIELTTDPGDLVMDPFAGSGVTLAQAAVMGRHYIGFELNPDYIKIFEETVKVEVAAEWEEMKSWREKQAQARLDFEQTIMKLRALKYARQVTRPFLSTISDDLRKQIQCVFCLATIPDEYLRGRPFPVQVLVVVEQPSDDFDSALEAAQKRATTPPLTQYGIQSEIRVITREALEQYLLEQSVDSERLCLYPSYKPRKFTAMNSLEDWFDQDLLEEFADKPKVPMLANIAVDVAWAIE